MNLHSPCTAVGLLLFSMMASCSLVLQTESTQCSTDGDCRDRGFANAECRGGVCMAPEATGGSGGGGGQGGTGAGGPWDCVGNVVWPPVDMGSPASFGLHITDVNFEAYEGLELRACKPLDIACTTPLSTALSGPDGNAFLDVNVGYEGYVRTTPPAANPEFLPFIVHIFPPPAGVETEIRNGDVLQIDQTSLELLAGLSGVEIEPNTGLIFFSALDCLDGRAAGVVVSVSPIGPNTEVAYLEGSFPNAELTETGDEGQGAIINVPPGLVEVTGVSLESGKFFQSSVLVEAGTITGVPVVPGPL